MKKDEKNGFTLMELLAVIVILTVIAIITIPVIMNVIEDAKIKSAELSTFGYLDAFEKQMAMARMKKERYGDGTYAIGDLFLNQNPVSHKGTAPEKGKIEVAKQRVISAELCMNGYPIEYQNGEAIYNKTKNTCNQDIVFRDDYYIATEGKMKEPVLGAETDGFYGSTIQRKDVERIITINTKIVPENAIESIDVSVDQNKTVMIWFLDEDGNGKYELYIGAKGKVVLTSAKGLFMKFVNATSIDLTYLDTSEVTDMAGMFNICKSVKSLDLSRLNTKNVTRMKIMFQQCNSLKELDLSSFDTSSLTDIGAMFNACTNLTNLNITNFDTSKVTRMESMFRDCRSLESLDISHFDTSNVTQMQGMFYQCTNLSSLVLGEFNILNVTNTGSSMFEGSSKLATIKTTNATTKTWLEQRLSESNNSATVVLTSL